MDKLIEAFAQRTWFIDALGAIILASLVATLILVSMHMLNKHLHDFFHFLEKEAKEFIQMKPTLGAINFLLIIVLILFGVLVIIAIEGQKIAGILSSYIGITKADIFAKSADFNTLFYVVAAVTVISVVSVAIDNRKG